MQEEVFKFISATFGISAAITFAVIMLAFWLVYFITKKVTMIHARHAELEKDEREMEQRVLNTLDRNEDNTRRRFESVENKINEIRRDMSYIKGNIDFLRNGGANLIQSHSPISLTNEGKEIATQIDADGIICKNWEKIRKNK